MADSISPFGIEFNEPKEPGRFQKPRSILWKVLMIVSLILGLLIPLHMIGGVLAERQANKEQVVAEIIEAGAGKQSLTGPILAVPYTVNSETILESGKKVIHTFRKNAYLLPQDYKVQSTIDPETRHRGIFQSMVYSTKILAQGNFNLKALESLQIAPEQILWKDAFVVVGVTNTQGINLRPDFNWQNKPQELLPGLNGISFIGSGLYSPVAITPEQSNVPFKLALSLQGSQTLSVVPLGKQNTITLNSSWTSPSFMGSPIPKQPIVNSNGFKATWEIPYFARRYGQLLTDTSDLRDQLIHSAVGVELLTPVDSYRQSERAIKYGVLFLVLTFATYFLFEIISKYRLHPLQYLLVGCALSLFYLLLIAISEVVQFGAAYFIASLGTIMMITLYSKALLGKIRKHSQLIIGGLLTILYTYLYILLQLEDQSLLFGSLGLFLVLAFIMYVTRHIDWYNEQIST